jgi:hypothetical protein
MDSADAKTVVNGIMRSLEDIWRYRRLIRRNSASVHCLCL